MRELRPISYVRPANLAARAYDELESAIVRCVLRPEQVVTDRGLAAALNISRTPVREALQRLTATGLVRQTVRGWMVAGFDETDVRELFELRRALEPLGVDKLVTADGATVAELGAFFDRFAGGVASDDYEHYFARDHAFHKRIVEASGNARVIAFYEVVEKQIDRGRHFLSMGVAGRVEANLQEHLAIATALGRRDAEGARAALLHHLRRGEEEMATHIQTERQAGRLGAD